MVCERGRRRARHRSPASVRDAQSTTATTTRDDRRCRMPIWSPTSALLVADLPTYGYRRVHALLRRQAEKSGLRKRPIPSASTAS